MKKIISIMLSVMMIFNLFILSSAESEYKKVPVLFDFFFGRFVELFTDKPTGINIQGTSDFIFGTDTISFYKNEYIKINADVYRDDGKRCDNDYIYSYQDKNNRTVTGNGPNLNRLGKNFPEGETLVTVYAQPPLRLFGNDYYYSDKVNIEIADEELNIFNRKFINSDRVPQSLEYFTEIVEKSLLDEYRNQGLTILRYYLLDTSHYNGLITDLKYDIKVTFRDKNSPLCGKEFNYTVSVVYCIPPYVEGLDYLFWANDGTDSAVSGTYLGDEALPECVFIRRGYDFVGWCPIKGDAPVGIIRYEDVNEDDLILPGEYGFTSDTWAFYAIWKLKQPTVQITYSVTFDPNGGDGKAPEGVAYINSDTILIPAADGLSKEGCTFRGWSRDPNATTPQFSPGDFMMCDSEDIILYAVWQQNQ